MPHQTNGLISQPISNNAVMVKEFPVCYNNITKIFVIKSNLRGNIIMEIQLAKTLKIPASEKRQDTG